MSSRRTSLFLLLCVVLGAPLFANDDVVVLTRNDRTPIVQFDGDDPVVVLRETAGQSAVFRLRIDDASRVIALGAMEERAVHLRSLFTDSVLGRDAVIVETLRGSGTVVPSPEFEAKTAAHRRAVAPPKALPTSTALIDDAEQKGTLDSETALLYRIYALVSDARLPAQYRGDDSGIIDSQYFEDVRQRFASLSAATQAAVTPYLVPPAYKGSWTNVKAGSPVAKDIGNPLLPCKAAVIDNSWLSVDGMTTPVRVWYDTDVPGDALYASAVASELDRVIWPKLIGLMHPAGAATGFPVNDEPESCNGGDNRVDIYLIDGSTSFAIPYDSTKPTPGFITLVRGSDLGVVAHELFHVIQFSYPDASILPSTTRWWKEGSANWAIDYVYGKTHQIEQPFSYYLLNYPQTPLDDSDDKHRYASYLLPFYQFRKTSNADFVRKSWENIATKEPLDAIDDAIGGFDKVWPQFARYNWNEAPFNEYRKWDDLSFGARPEENGTRTLSGSEVSVDLPYELPRLSAIYHHFKFDDSMSSVVFWNGVTTKLARRDISGGVLGPQYINDSADGDAIKGAHVTALVNINGNWDEQDWTGRNYVTFCRDLESERIDELVLIISNSEFKDKNRTLKPAGLAPVLFASNMGCWKWKGHVSYASGGVSIETDITWTRASGTTQPLRIDYAGDGTATYSITNPGCSTRGTAAVSSSESSLSSYNLAPSDSPLARTYIGAGAVPIKVCGGTASFPWLTMPLAPFPIPAPLARFLYVSSDGKTMDGSFGYPNSGTLWTWHFEAQKE